MKTKCVDKNPQGDMEAVVSLTDQDVIFLREVVKMYDDRRLRDLDDKNMNNVKKGLISELHEAFKQLRPS